VKAGGKPSNQLAGIFGLYRKQERNGTMALSSHWLAMGQNETARLYHYHQANQWEIEQGSMGPRKEPFLLV
jgi:hypothetical protein